jgi:GNAT superfamily N-acetyltransferase
VTAAAGVPEVDGRRGLPSRCAAGCSVPGMTDFRLEPMTQEQYLAFRESTEGDYADQIAKSGVSPVDAAEKAAADYARLLPDGLGSPDQFLFTGYDGAEPVGWIWVQIKPRADGLNAYVFDLQVRQEQRRRGYGRAIMQAAEQLCRERGVVSMGLNVFGFNTGARSLYDQLGFEVAAVQMTKRL